MQLSVLVDGAEARIVKGSADVEILSLSADSRACEPGTLFAALPGTAVDGRNFVGGAVAAGASAVLAGDWDLDVIDSGSAALIAADAPRRSFSLICSNFFGVQPATAIAVTGTNGKSSVTEFCRQFWSALDQRGATIGTLGVIGPDGSASLAHTTPDPVTLHGRLRDLADEGIDRVALEASSHGLDQHRLDGVSLRAAAFTNLTQDHFDYHPSVEAYLAAKTRLFDLVVPGGTAVLNADIPEFEGLVRHCRDRGLEVVSLGESGTNLRLIEQESLANGHQRLVLDAGGEPVDIELPLAGYFQAMNMMCAAAMIAAVESLSLAEVLRLAEGLCGVRGRLEPVAGHPAGARIYVDYAHTPDALENVLEALRGDVAGRLVVVFGCGGDRDAAKRPLMGAIARRIADRAYVTDDNPRTEDAATIRAAVLEAVPDALEIGDRREAIRTAVAELAPGDVLVIAGKGHEPGQTVGTTVYPFDDVDEARAAIAALEGGA